MCSFTFLSLRFLACAPLFILGKLFLEKNTIKSSFIIESPLPAISFTTEDTPGYTNEAAKGAQTAPTNPPFCFFISCFTVSVTPSINTLESSSDFMILIISSIQLFEMNRMNPSFCSRGPFSIYTYFSFKLISD